jgi:hypothetical protein
MRHPRPLGIETTAASALIGGHRSAVAKAIQAALDTAVTANLSDPGDTEPAVTPPTRQCRGRRSPEAAEPVARGSLQSGFYEVARPCRATNEGGGCSLFAAAEVETAGWGGLKVMSDVTGFARSTITGFEPPDRMCCCAGASGAQNKAHDQATPTCFSQFLHVFANKVLTKQFLVVSLLATVADTARRQSASSPLIERVQCS